jgi:hypothetical protein
VLQNAVSDLQSCPERSARVEDAIRLIRKELMPRLSALANRWLIQYRPSLPEQLGDVNRLKTLKILP